MVEFLATDLSDYVAGAVDPDRWRTGAGIIRRESRLSRRAHAALYREIYISPIQAIVTDGL
jgi:hypothetical protein